jgi:hypothetical protein
MQLVVVIVRTCETRYGAVGPDETVRFISSDPNSSLPAHTTTRGRNRDGHVNRVANTSETDRTLGSATNGVRMFRVNTIRLISQRYRPRRTASGHQKLGIVAVQTQVGQLALPVQFTTLSSYGVHLTSNSISLAAVDNNQVNVRPLADLDPPPFEPQHGPYRTRFTFSPEST